MAGGDRAKRVGMAERSFAMAMVEGSRSRARRPGYLGNARTLSCST